MPSSKRHISRCEGFSVPGTTAAFLLLFFVLASCSVPLRQYLSIPTPVGDIPAAATPAPVVLPASITSVATGTYNGSNIKSISMPGATTIGADSFLGCAALTTVSMPAAITTITIPAGLTPANSVEAFKGCSDLTTINLGANPNFSIVNGVLYDVAQQELIRSRGAIPAP